MGAAMSTTFCACTLPVRLISDSGPGSPPEQRDKIFQLYFTTKKQGSGIGLAIAFRVAQLHGGKIEFSSNPGQGTTFMLLLPLIERAQVRAESERAPGGAESTKGHE